MSNVYLFTVDIVSRKLLFYIINNRFGYFSKLNIRLNRNCYNAEQKLNYSYRVRALKFFERTDASLSSGTQSLLTYPPER